MISDLSLHWAEYALLAYIFIWGFALGLKNMFKRVFALFVNGTYNQALCGRLGDWAMIAGIAYFLLEYQPWK